MGLGRDSIFYPLVLVLGLLALFGCGRTRILFYSDTSSDTEASDTADDPYNDSSEDEAPCRLDDDCQNGLACDGQEKCMDGVCVPGEPLICDDGNDCTIDACSEDEAGCMFIPRDLDGDGFGDAACGGADCDDSRDDVYPGAPGGCSEGEDLNCTGTPDLDEDQDGYADESCPGGDDCDDNDPDTYPGASEVCLDGKDQDCDGIVDGPMLMSSSVKISDQGSGSMTISIAWTGSLFGIAWDGIYFTRVNADGVEIGEEIMVSRAGDYSSDPSMVWTGREFVIAYVTMWLDGLAGATGDIYLARLPWGAYVEDEIRLTSYNARNDDLRPSIAWSGSVLGVAWHHYTEYASEWHGYIHYKEIDSMGADATEEMILDENARGLLPRLTWAGSEFGIIWKCGGICFLRIRTGGDRVGEIIELAPIESGLYPIPPMTWTGSEYGLAWADDCIEPRGGSQTYFARISASGVKETDDVMISHTTNIFSQSPVLAWTGSEFGLVFVSSENGCCTDYYPHLVFVHLDRNGDVLSETELDEEAEIGLKYPLDVVWTGSELGIVWVWNHFSSQSGTYFNRIGFCD